MSAAVRHITAGVALAATLSACGNIETTGSDRDTATAPTDTTAGADLAGDVSDGLDAEADVVDHDPEMAARFVQERLGIADQWYDYDGATHVVTARPESYLLQRNEAAWLLRVESYYDDRGESGVFTVSSRSWDGFSWGAPQRLTTSGNVKQAPVCLALTGLAEVDCDGSGHDLVLRTELRIVPAAGFAVGNPALYLTGHHLVGDTTSVRRLDGVEIGAVTQPPGALGGQRLASAMHDAADARIGRRAFLDDGSPRGHVYLQATGDGRLVQWQIVSAVHDGAASTLELRVRCQALADTAAEQRPLSEIEPVTLEIIAATGDAATLVELCPAAGEPAVVGSHAQPLLGSWPRSDGFDLIVEQGAEGPAVLVAPGHLVWDWSAAHGGDTDYVDVSPLDSLWDD